MLGLATTLRLDLAIDHAPPGPAGIRERVVLEKRAGESFDHVLMKLLAFALHHRPGLAIEASAGQKFKPDLLLADPDGTVRLWIDCGHVGAAKLDEVLRRNRSAEVVVVKPTARAARLFAAGAARRIARPDRIRIEGFGDGFLAELAELAEDRARLAIEVGAGAVRVRAGDRTIASEVWSGPLGDAP